MSDQELTQTDVGAMLGMHQVAISKRLTGQVKWSLEDLTRLAVALDVDLDRILPVLEIQRFAS